jgi:hypothetical protein
MLVYDAPTKRLLHANALDLHHDPQHRAVPADHRFRTCLVTTVIVWHVDISLFDAVALTARLQCMKLSLTAMSSY